MLDLTRLRNPVYILLVTTSGARSQVGGFCQSPLNFRAILTKLKREPRMIATFLTTLEH